MTNSSAVRARPQSAGTGCARAAHAARAQAHGRASRAFEDGAARRPCSARRPRRSGPVSRTRAPRRAGGVRAARRRGRPGRRGPPRRPLVGCTVRGGSSCQLEAPDRGTEAREACSVGRCVGACPGRACARTRATARPARRASARAAAQTRAHNQCQSVVISGHQWSSAHLQPKRARKDHLNALQATPELQVLRELRLVRP